MHMVNPLCMVNSMQHHYAMHAHMWRRSETSCRVCVPDMTPRGAHTQPLWLCSLQYCCMVADEAFSVFRAERFACLPRICGGPICARCINRACPRPVSHLIGPTVTPLEPKGVQAHANNRTCARCGARVTLVPRWGALASQPASHVQQPEAARWAPCDTLQCCMSARVLNWIRYCQGLPPAPVPVQEQHQA